MKPTRRVAVVEEFYDILNQVHHKDAYMLVERRRYKGMFGVNLNNALQYVENL